MPLSTVCVSTVSSRPRLWSSHTNIRIREKDVPPLMIMNGTEEISVYKNPQDFYHNPAVSKRALGYSYDFPEKPLKKEKKWSIGSLFRRKKKEETESSSEEEQKRGFLGRRRRKSDGKRRKPSKTVGTFDHVVLPKNHHGYNGYNHHEDTGILSDPSGGFTNYPGRTTLAPTYSIPQSNNTSINNLHNSIASVGSVGSGDSFSKKGRRDLAKARAAARRTTLGNESSSDEDSSIRSHSSLRMRSDESLSKHDSGHSRRSRVARTERYLKRHSKDGENPHNYLRLSKSDADDSNRSPSRSPNLPVSTRPYQTSISSSQASNMSGMSTIPPSHGVHGKHRISNSTSNPSYKPPLSMNEYNNSVTKTGSFETDKNLNNQRSISCDANIHKVPSFEDERVIHVQFPIMRINNRGYRNLSLIDSSQVSSARQPPQPPPRDPNRCVLPHYFENGRPNTFYLENNSSHTKSKSFHAPAHNNPPTQNKLGSFNFHPSYRSTSEVHIPNDPFQLQTTVRPASTTPEPPKPNRYMSGRRNERHTVDNFNYLTDKKPRSRKPIVIQTNISKDCEARRDSPTQKALDFWKQIEENISKSCTKKPVSSSPQMFTSQTRVQTQVFLPSVVQSDSSKLEPSQNSNHFKPVSPTVNEIRNNYVDSPRSSSNLDEVSKEDIKRKSTNLEEALDELEAIYNSLKLGDENLLDRAEQRENESLSKKLEESKRNSYKPYGASRGALSDSSFSYEPFDQVDSPRRKKVSKKNRIPDTKGDDMYNRKLAKEKSATISDPQSVINKVSYLLSSPLHACGGNNSDGENKKKNNNKEPDVTLDDLLYRNVKHANSSPKTVEPQPPFGIPLGPVTPAPNSDYLHAVPEAVFTPSYKSKKIPDVVKDDLAFRNLRKGSNKEPALPPSSIDDVKNSIYPAENVIDLNYLRKRRAVRSLSANIGNILGKNIQDSDEDMENEFRTNTLTDIADAMEIARKVLQEKGKDICATKKAFMSDTDAKSTYTNGDTFKESRLKFLNGLKNSENSLSKNLLSVKPPRGLTFDRKISRSPTKESTPIPKSPLDDNGSTNSSLDDLLNALAEEAKVTTERITRELQELEEKRQRNDDLDDQRKTKDNNISGSLKPCQKLLKAVVDSNDLVKYSKTPSECVETIKVDSPPTVSANIIQSCFAPSNDESETNKDESEHDYENIDSGDDEVDLKFLEKDIDKQQFVKCQSPFEERKADLVATFQELKKDIDDIKIPRFSSNDESKKTESIYDNLDDAPSEVKPSNDEGEHKFDACLENELPNNTNTQIFTANKDITLHSNYLDHLTSENNLDSLESLKSPKLVMETSKKCISSNAVPKSSNMVLDLSKRANHFHDSDIPRPSTSSRNPVSPCRQMRDDLDHDPRKPGGPWYHDPTKVALACTYGIACAHQLASIDLVAILGIVFAIMSFIVALFM